MLSKNYQYVIAVAEAGNFSKAAENLYMAQSSLSQYIKNLEAELGTTLFDRSHHPIAVTAAGKRFLQTAYEIQYLENQLERQMIRLTPIKKGTLTIGITRYWGSLLLPRVLPDFEAKYPQIELKILEGRTTNIVQALENKLVRLAFFTPPNDFSFAERYHKEPILKEEIKLAVHPDKAPKQAQFGSTITKNQLQQLSFILLHKGQKMRQIADNIFRSLDDRPQVVMETENITTAYKLASVGFAATFVPKNITELTNPFGKVLHLSLADPLYWEMNAFYPQDKALWEPAEYFLMLTKKAFASS